MYGRLLRVDFHAIEHGTHRGIGERLVDLAAWKDVLTSPSPPVDG